MCVWVAGEGEGRREEESKRGSGVGGRAREGVEREEESKRGSGVGGRGRECL